MPNSKIFLITLWPVYTVECYGAVDKKKVFWTVLAHMILFKIIKIFLLKEDYVIERTVQ